MRSSASRCAASSAVASRLRRAASTARVGVGDALARGAERARARRRARAARPSSRSIVSRAAPARSRVGVEQPEPRHGPVALGAQRRDPLAQRAGRARRPRVCSASTAAMRSRAAASSRFERRRCSERSTWSSATRSSACSRERTSCSPLASAPIRARAPRPTRGVEPLDLGHESLQLRAHVAQRDFGFARQRGRDVALGARRRRAPPSPRRRRARSARARARSCGIRSRSVSACARRARIERSLRKRPPVIAPPPTICSPSSVTIESRKPSPRMSAIPVRSSSTTSTSPDQERDDARDSAARRARACARSR